MILLIDNYDSFTHNLAQLLGALGARVRVVRNDEVDVAGIARLRPRSLVLSPGPGNPDEAGVTLAAIRAFAGRLPILGVCLGHQAIAQAFGGRLVRARRPVHGKVSPVRHSGRGLYAGVRTPFSATRYHSLVVDPSSLPSCLRVTARTGDGVIMGVRHRRYDVEGLQFHPESILTADGPRLLGNFLERS